MAILTERDNTENVIAETGHRSCEVRRVVNDPAPTRWVAVCTGGLGFEVLQPDGLIKWEPPRPVTFDLTQEWINACAAPYTTRNNPVALFMVSATSRSWSASFRFLHCYRDGVTEYPMFIMYTPEPVADWLRRLNNGEAVEPFSFTMMLPESEAPNAV